MQRGGDAEPRRGLSQGLSRPGRFVFVSSIAAAGPNVSERPATEGDPPRPVSPYGRSKLAAERAVLEAATRMPVTVVRPPNVLGPGSKELERAIRLVRRRIVPAIGDSRPRTSLVDVDDLVEALILAAESPRSPGQTYFVTDGRAYAWPEITAAIAEELGVRGFRVSVPFAVQMLAARLAETAARLTPAASAADPGDRPGRPGPLLDLRRIEDRARARLPAAVRHARIGPPDGRSVSGPRSGPRARDRGRGR